jgi:hypothetical protein
VAFMRRALVTCILLCGCAWSQPHVTFDDSAADRLRITATNYGLTLSKVNGAILAITDRKTNVRMSVASRNGCLWGST